jgi:hypothetical protein
MAAFSCTNRASAASREPLVGGSISISNKRSAARLPGAREWPNDFSPKWLFFNV